MIAVIADDFTGAAEIGGIGLKYGLKVIIETKVKNVSNVDLLIIATDTRSLSAQDASLEILKITKDLIELNPKYIYKKLDSVLRGNIVHELVAQMSVTGKKRAIVVAGNPFFGRIIKDGIYSINAVPLDKTHFAVDPDFPLNSSSVVQILKNDEINVVSKSVDDELPNEDLIIGDISNSIDMLKWVGKIDSATEIAGGSGFFDTLLESKYVQNPYPFGGKIHTGKRTLIVLGSTYPKSKELLKRFDDAGVVFENMPEEIYCNTENNETHFENWVNEVTSKISRNKKVIVSVNFSFSKEEKLALRIKKTISKLVKRVIQEIELTDLIIEGGATTSEILGELKISKLYPCKELNFGIIQMKVDEYPNMCITTKPGSYSWPQNISFENKEGKIKLTDG